MVLYKTVTPLISRIVNDGNRYLVPREDGYLLAGSVEEEVGYVCETTDGAISQIREWAQNLLPQLSRAPVLKKWAGLRPGSFDGFPYVGQVPGCNNLFIASGHFRSGIHLSCGTAHCIADLMEGRTPPVDLTPFRIGRG